MTQMGISSKGEIPKIFVVCDQSDTAPVWGYMLGQKGLNVTLETSAEKAVDRWLAEISDLVVLDLDIPHPNRMQLYANFRAVCVSSILLFLPAYLDTDILEE